MRSRPPLYWIDILGFIGYFSIGALLTWYILVVPPKHNIVYAQTASGNQLLLTLRQLDLSGTPVLNRRIGYVTYNGVVGTFTNNILTTVNPTAQTLPTTNVLQLYFRNTHATANITVTWTPQGSGSVVVKKVGPGGVLTFWEKATGDGITALSLQSDVINATYEMFLGG